MCEISGGRKILIEITKWFHLDLSVSNEDYPKFDAVLNHNEKCGEPLTIKLCSRAVALDHVNETYEYMKKYPEVSVVRC